MRLDRSLLGLPVLLVLCVALFTPLSALAQTEQTQLAEISSRIYLSRWLMVITCLWAAACWWVTRFAEKPMDATTGALLAATWGVLPLLCKLYLDLGAQIIHAMPPVIEASLFLVLGALVYMIFLTAYAPDITERERDARGFDIEGRRRRPSLFAFFVYLAITWPMIAVGAVIHLGGGDGLARDWVPMSTLGSVIVMLLGFIGVVLAVLVRTNLRSYQMPPLPRLMIMLYGLAAALVLPAVGISNTDLPPLLLPLAALYGTFACVLFLHGFMNFREEELWRQAQLLRSLSNEEEDEEEEEEPTLLPHDLPIGWLFLIGVAYPAITLFFSLPRPDGVAAPFASNIFFIFSLAPVLLALAFAALWRPGERNPPRWTVFLVIATLGAVAGVGAYVLIGYAPVTIIRAALGTPQGLLLPVIALIFCGVVALTLAHVVLTRSGFSQWRRPLHFTFRCFAALLALSLLLPDATALVQRLSLISTMKSDGQDQRLMRLVGEEQALLQAAYTGETLRERNSPRTVDWIESLVANLQPGSPRQYEVTRDQARGIFYRLTGQSISARPRPPALSDVSFDADYGSGGVGGRLPNVRMTSVTLTASSAEPVFPRDASLPPEQSLMDDGFWRGTLRFGWQNDDWQDHQIRVLLHLPQGARIDAARRQTVVPPGSSTASPASGNPYVNPRVAIVDPPDLRLYSTRSGLTYLALDGIEAHGGRLAAELDVSLPILRSDWQPKLLLPRIMEQNATMDQNLRLEAIMGGAEDQETAKTLFWPEAGGKMATIPLARAGQTFPEPDRLQDLPAAVVIDLSRQLRASADDIAELTRILPEDTEFLFTGEDAPTADNWPVATDYRGGKDAGQALATALARGAKSGRPVLWITGPQPVYLRESVDSLAQLSQLTTGKRVQLHVLSEGVGNNLYLFSPFLLQTVSGLDVRLIDRRGELGEDLRRILRGIHDRSSASVASLPASREGHWVVTHGSDEQVLALRDPSLVPLDARAPEQAEDSPLELGLAPRAAWFLLTLFLLLKAVFVIRRTWLDVVSRTRGRKPPAGTATPAAAAA